MSQSNVIETQEIHQARTDHAFKSLGLFILIAFVTVVFESLIFWLNPNAFIVATVTGFCALLFYIGIVGWHSGKSDLDAQAKEYIEDKKQQRKAQDDEHKLQIQIHKLREQQFRAAMLQPQKQLTESRDMILGRNLQVKDPQAKSVVRIDVIPPQDFLKWLWTDGNENGVPWGEERTAKRWGKESDAWLAELAKPALGFIQQRDRNTRTPGVLSRSLDEALQYFHPTPLSVVVEGNIER